MTHQRA